MIDLDAQSLRRLIEARLRGTRPSLALDALRLPATPGDLPAPLRPRLLAKPPVPAAVLVPLVERDSGLHVLLTLRTAHLRDHAGQVSFPGGRMEAADESPAAAALRETFEEIGLGADYIEVVGYLDTYLTITGYAVVPVVAFVRDGFSLALDEFEVAGVFEVPLRVILDPANHRLRQRDLHGAEVAYYEIPYEDHHIWGATAGMLVGLQQRLASGRAAASDQ
jgi:8-oxo-dGTP pyrophosphatase MutT (NUDIX family)